MFIGEYQHNLDDKGRLAIPAKFRAELKNGMVATKGFDDCLFLYTKKEWETLVKEKLSKLPTISQSGARAIARHLLAGAMEVDLDSQGRINLPEYLCKFAKLSKKTVIAGLVDRLEIWNEDIWEKYKQATEKKADKIAAGLADLGL